MPRTLVALSLLAFTTLAAAAHAREVLVLDATRPATTIVLAADATTAAQYGALELQYHLEKITGVKPPVVREPVPASPPGSGGGGEGTRIALGNTALGKSLGFPVDQLQPWEFLVGEKNGTIVLAGGDAPVTDEAKWESLNHLFNGEPNGSALAVFEFLEQCCGVHWYLPSEAGMVYPQTKRLVAKMGDTIRRRTDFRSSSFYPYQVNKNMFCRPVRPDLTGQDVPDDESERWRRGLYRIPIKLSDMLPVIEVQRWLLNHVVPAIVEIEAGVLDSIRDRFEALFADWFARLVESDDLRVAVDASFSPVVQSGEYELEHETLSGGERTSLALAYRLALSTMVRQEAGITRESLLVLDEPTDGFSSQQLNRLREVLAETGCDQTIIVSHEQELEGVADTVYGVTKESSGSRVVLL